MNPFLYRFRVCCDVGAYVSCREYDGIPSSAQSFTRLRIKVAPRIFFFTVFVLDRSFLCFCQGLFCALTGKGEIV